MRVSTAPPSDAERERIAAELRSAVGAGIVSLEEFETRLDRVYKATSIGELEQLVRWLPLPAPRSRRGSAAGRRRAWLVTMAAVAATAALAVVAAAIRPSTGPAASKQSAAGGGVERLANSCGLIAAEDVSQVVGADVGTPQRSFVGESADQCLWWAGGEQPAVTVQLGSDLADFRSYHRTTDGDIPGLGEQAAVDSSNAGLVLVRTDEAWFEVRVHRTADDRAAALAIAEHLLARLESP